MDRRRDSAKARDRFAPFNSRGQKVPMFTAPRPRKESKTIGFGGVLWVLSVAGDRKCPAGGRCVTSSAVERADVGIGPYGEVTRSAVSGTM